MNKLKSIAVSSKDFVAAHKGTVALTALAVLQIAALRKHDRFLQEKGLYNEYHGVIEA